MHPQRSPVPLQRVMDWLFASRQPYRSAQTAATPTARQAVDALLHALERGDEPRIYRLLEEGRFDPQVLGAEGRLVLVEAVARGRWDVARRLVDLGADPRAMDGQGRTAFGEIWLQANGGPQLDPAVSPQSTGKAGEVYRQWQVAFPIVSPEAYFSVAHRHHRLTAAQAARFDLQADWKPVGADRSGDSSGTTPWADIISPGTLRLRQQERRARLISRPTEGHEVSLASHPSHRC